ncbi:glycosyltransferase [Brevibacterium casei]|nr:glycosyltransferase [Brevibacterium casei]
MAFFSRTPDVTIGIPAYNAEQYLPTCLQSIADQTADLRRIETIVVDDGSTDGTAELADRLLKDLRLRGARGEEAQFGHPRRTPQCGPRSGQGEVDVLRRRRRLPRPGGDRVDDRARQGGASRRRRRQVRRCQPRGAQGDVPRDAQSDGRAQNAPHRLAQRPQDVSHRIRPHHRLPVQSSTAHGRGPSVRPGRLCAHRPGRGAGRRRLLSLGPAQDGGRLSGAPDRSCAPRRRVLCLHVRVLRRAGARRRRGPAPRGLSSRSVLAPAALVRPPHGDATAPGTRGPGSVDRGRSSPHGRRTGAGLIGRIQPQIEDYAQGAGTRRP